VFHHPDPPLLVKRVVGIPATGCVLKMAGAGEWTRPVEPYAALSRAVNPSRDDFPAKIYTDRKSIRFGGGRCKPDRDGS